MATEKLIVKNFGPIREAELDLKKVTVFIGEQASGKSVLAKLITIISKPQFNKAPSLYAFLEQLSFFEIDGFLNDDSFIYCKVDNLEFNLINRELQFTMSPNLRKLEFSTELFNSDKNKSNDNTDLNLTQRLEQSGKLINPIFKNTIYIPTERFLISIISNSFFSLALNNITLPKYLLSFGQLFEESRRENKSFKTNVIKNLSFSFKDEKNIVDFNENKIELSKSSSGIQSLIPLLLCINHTNLDKNAKRFVIEEPELNLYPSTQKKLVEYLIENCTKDDNRLILTTHSPYILTTLNNLIQAKNVVKQNPELAEEVSKIVPPQYQLDFDDIAVYFVADGTVRSILNNENQLIDATALDDISNEISEDFGKLIQLEFQNEPL